MAVAKRVMDFTNVKEAGQFNPRRMKPGDYKAKITKVEDHESKSGNAQWLFTLSVGARNTYPYYCAFEEKQLWKIRNLLIAAGKQVPKKRVAVDPTKLVGATVGVSLEDDEYEGKVKSIIVAVFPADEVDNDDADTADADDDADETEEVSEEEMEELDIEEL